MARETIAKTDHYMYEVDTDINRLYTTIWGLWKDAGVAPNVLRDIGLALEKLQPGFTNLVDSTRFKTPSKDVMELFNEVQQKILAKGISKNAEVVSSAFVELNLEKVLEQSELSDVSRQFKNMAEALVWLSE